MDARPRPHAAARFLSLALSTGATLVSSLTLVEMSTVDEVSADAFVTAPAVSERSRGEDRAGLASAASTPTVREFRLRRLQRGPAEPPRPQGITPSTLERPGAGGRPAAPAAPLVVRSKPRPVSGYGVVGATWDGPRPGELLFTVRTRLTGAGWSKWQTLHGGDCPCEYCTQQRVAVAAGHGPNMDSPEFAQARQGTDAMAVGEVDQVQLRVISPGGHLPEDLRLSVVDPQPTITTHKAATSSAAAHSPAEAGDDLELVAESITGLAPKPKILTRSDWGANEKLRSGSPSYGTIKAGFVHHTVNANDYTRKQVPSIIRGIYAYHTQSRGWSDIGYNFLVDQFGRIWEGRYGGMRRPVIGAHTLGYNHLSFAMSAIGNFDIAEPPPAVAEAYAALYAWKLDRHDVPAKSTPKLDGRRFKAISGHRDAGSTACPGRYLYAQLPSIRTKAANIQAAADNDTSSPPPPPPAPEPGPEVARDLHADGRADLLVRDRATGRIQVLPGAGGPGFADRQMMGVTAGRVDLIAGVGDLTGDAIPDLLIRNKASGVAKVRPGRPGGLFDRALEGSVTSRFADADLVTGVGNMVGTRWPDLVARDRSTGRIWLYPGRSGGRFRAGTRLPIRPADVRGVTGPGDLTGDGRPDLLTTTPDGRLLAYPGAAAGSVGAPSVVSERWANRDLTVAGVDLTGDGTADLLARDKSTGKTFIYALQPGGHPGPRFGGWTTWADLNRLTVIGDPGTGTARLIARTKAGELVALDSQGTSFFGQATDTGRRVADGNYAQVAGDWDGDGNTDVITRSAGTGNVGLHRGDGKGLLDSRTRLWAGWTDKSDLVVTGDLTGDELPDMIARDREGALYVYPGGGEGGRQARHLIRSRLFAADLITAVGFWNDDEVRDLVVRRTKDGRLYLLPGRSDGTLGSAVRLTDVFAGYDRILGVGDHDGDGHADLVATTPTGELWLFPGKDDGLRKRRYLGAGMDRFDLLG